MEVVGPKWEDLNIDCLVNILARVGMESLLLDVPYVCKSWYNVTCNPQCWSNIDFEEIFSLRWNQKYQLDWVRSCNGFMKNIAKRGNIFVTHMKLPDCCTHDTLDVISDECPNLKTLKLTAVCELPLKHCKDLTTLEAFKCKISEDDVSALVSLPNLKSLSMRSSDISKEHLLMILKGCKRLEYLDARYCFGFDENDAEILSSAAHVLSVQLEGSSSFSSDDEDDEYYSDDNDDYEYYGLLY